MSEKDMNKRSGTDWARLDAMTDEEIDYSEIPPLGKDFFERAELRAPHEPQIVVTVGMDPDVFAWFEAQGEGWERRIQAALRIYVEAHKERKPVPAT